MKKLWPKQQKFSKKVKLILDKIIHLIREQEDTAVSSRNLKSAKSMEKRL